MKLSYRGISYNYSPVQVASADLVQPKVDLKYRGASYRRGEVAKGDRLSTLFKYRGVAYSNQPATPTVTPVAATAISVDEQVRQLNLNHDRGLRNRQHSMLTRMAAEISAAV